MIVLDLTLVLIALTSFPVFCVHTTVTTVRKFMVRGTPGWVRCNEIRGWTLPLFRPSAAVLALWMILAFTQSDSATQRGLIVYGAAGAAYCGWKDGRRDDDDDDPWTRLGRRVKNAVQQALPSPQVAGAGA